MPDEKPSDPSEQRRERGGAEREPVLGMLRARRRAEEEEPEPKRGGLRKLATALGVTIAVLAPAGVVAALTTRDTSEDRADQAATGEGGSRPFAPESQAVADPFPTDPSSASRYPVAYIAKRTPIYDKPNGKVRLRLTPKTEWNSPRILGVVERRGNWLAVLVADLKNGEVGWLKDSQVARLETVAWSLHADLSKRRLVVRRNGEDVRKFKVGVGRPEYRTPAGRYAVTDKLRVNSPDSPYGCCVLALSGHQTKLPRGWPGGDRLAVHATRDTGGLGKAVSLGCLRAETRDARWMMKNIPLGAPVFVSE